MLRGKLKLNDAAQGQRERTPVGVIEKLHDADSAARILGDVQPQTLAVWRCKGIGPAYIKLTNRLVRYRESDLLAFVERQLVNPEVR